MCVLAHLCDEDVADILKAIEKVAPVGSVWSASEPWGDEYHRDCWHIRTHHNGGLIICQIGSLSFMRIML